MHPSTVPTSERDNACVAEPTRPGITVRRFASNSDAERHDAEFWRQMPPHERVLLTRRLSVEQWQLLGRAEATPSAVG
jgi:hypothetical protein